MNTQQIWYIAFEMNEVAVDGERIVKSLIIFWHWELLTRNLLNILSMLVRRKQENEMEWNEMKYL